MKPVDTKLNGDLVRGIERVHVCEGVGALVEIYCPVFGKTVFAGQGDKKFIEQVINVAANKKGELEEMKNLRGACYIVTHGMYAIILRKDIDLSTINGHVLVGHEMQHAAYGIAEEVGIKYRPQKSEEWFCYYTEWLTFTFLAAWTTDFAKNTLVWQYDWCEKDNFFLIRTEDSIDPACYI